eukprot:Pgem_evm1s19375
MKFTFNLFLAFVASTMNEAAAFPLPGLVPAPAVGLVSNVLCGVHGLLTGMPCGGGMMVGGAMGGPGGGAMGGSPGGGAMGGSPGGGSPRGNVQGGMPSYGNNRPMGSAPGRPGTMSRAPPTQRMPSGINNPVGSNPGNTMSQVPQTRGLTNPGGSTPGNTMSQVPQTRGTTVNPSTTSNPGGNGGKGGNAGDQKLYVTINMPALPKQQGNLSKGNPSKGNPSKGNPSKGNPSKELDPPKTLVTVTPVSARAGVAITPDDLKQGNNTFVVTNQ